MAKAMTIGDLLDTLGAMDAAREDVEPPMTDEEWRDLEIVVRGADAEGNDFCGSLRSVGFEEACGDGGTFAAFDASNEREDDRG